MADRTTPDDPSRRRAQLKRRVEAGDWLLVSEVAELFDKHRSTIHRWIQVHGLIRYRLSSPTGGTSALECNPEDVKKQLARRRQVHGGPVRG